MLEMMLGNSLAAAALAAIVVILCRTLRPSPAARHALWLVVVVKLVSPIGLMWSFPLPFESPRLWEEPNGAILSETSRLTMPQAIVEEQLFVTALLVDPSESPVFEFPPHVNDAIETPSAAETAVVASSDRNVEPIRNSWSLYLWLAIVWLAGAIVAAGRYARRTMRFSHYARSGKLASPSLTRQVAELSAVLGVRAPDVRILADLPSPVVWCLFRPVLLWPKGLQDQLSAGGRQAVLVHELAHLRRRDHWVRWLELAAAVIYWWNPLFWLARRQMRFHAELACDAWVTGTLPGTRRDYAEALLEVCVRSSRAAAPWPAVGVGGEGRRDFQRRLTMIMREQVPCRLATGVKLFVVLLLTAALPAWTLGQSKPQPKAEQGQGIKIELNGIDLGLNQGIIAFTDADADKKVKELEVKIAELKKQLEWLKAKAPAPNGAIKPRFELGGLRIIDVDQVPQATPKIVKPAAPGQPLQTELRWAIDANPAPKYKVIGPDGKEIQGAKVIVIDRQVKEAVKVKEAAKMDAVPMMYRAVVRATEHTGDVINLSRATYSLNKEKAGSLGAFLKENIKASVLELKVDEKGLTVTTTPEAQAAIKGLVKLMGQGDGQPRIRFLIKD
jgi:beta-lactamase regulating signal transducer with metallopeptidase domain